jgi:hypothetical protein
MLAVLFTTLRSTGAVLIIMPEDVDVYLGLPLIAHDYNVFREPLCCQSRVSRDLLHIINVGLQADLLANLLPHVR